MKIDFKKCIKNWKTFKDYLDFKLNSNISNIILLDVSKIILECWKETKEHFGNDFPFDDKLKIVFKKRE